MYMIFLSYFNVWNVLLYSSPTVPCIYNPDDDYYLIRYVNYYYFIDLFYMQGRCLHEFCGAANK
jgi:hypothetical protein